LEALVKTKKGEGFLEIREIEEPKMEGNEVLIRIRAAGICGTDLHIDEGRFHCNPPVVLGHEFSGEIIEVGKDVSDFKIGDRVVAEAHKGGCGTCRYCQRGEVEVCTQKRAIGYRIHGCFAPLLTLPASSLHIIPDNVTYEQAALTEPIAIVMKGLGQKCSVEPEDFVVVLGCGPIGLLAAAIAKTLGARSVVITGTDRDEKVRLQVARKLNIDYAVNVQEEDVVQKVKELTDGVGADLVIEASGAAPAIQQAFDLIRINGRVCGLGITGEKAVPFPWDTALLKAAEVNFSASSNWTSWTRALSILSSHRITVDDLITKTLPLSQWKEAFDLLRRLEAVKVLLIP
jgi:L-iditol 2-dehydrogenase